MVAIERFFQYLEFKGIKHTRVEKELEFSNGYLGKMKSRKASIGSDAIEKIVSYFLDLNIEWLITGKGEMLKTDSFDNTKTAPPDENRQVPYFMYEKLDNEYKELNENYTKLMIQNRDLMRQLDEKSSPKRATG